MKKITRKIFIIAFIGFVLIFSSCGYVAGEKKAVAEKIDIVSKIENEVEFEKQSGVKIKQDSETVFFSGNIIQMTNLQKSVFDGRYNFCLPIKILFDNERTISSFLIRNKNESFLYSTDCSVDGFYGYLTEIIDSVSYEDASSTLFVFPENGDYELISYYTDGTESTIKLIFNFQI